MFAGLFIIVAGAEHTLLSGDTITVVGRLQLASASMPRLIAAASLKRGTGRIYPGSGQREPDAREGGERPISTTAAQTTVGAKPAVDDQLGAGNVFSLVGC
jgi:hypothetical protein